MTRIEVWLTHAAVVLVGGTGVVYAIFHYFTTPTDPFAVVNHPWQPVAQHLHVLVAPVLVFAAGVLWRTHALGSLQQAQTRRRRSGIAMLLSFVPMVASGYLTQVVVEQRWRHTWGLVHTVVSLLWLAGYVIHQVVRRNGNNTGVLSSAAKDGAGPVV